MTFELISLWFVIKTILFVAALAAGIIFIFLSDDIKSIEEYIRRHPEEFDRHSQ